MKIFFAWGIFFVWW